MNSVAIIDYGMGNLRSVSKALEQVAPNAKILITSDPIQIQEADRVVFPGVGAIRDCLHELQTRALSEIIQICAETRPFLGICLGMQALFEKSEENEGTKTFGILPGQVLRFHFYGKDEKNSYLKVPHMGWNQVFPTTSHPLWQDISIGSRFYFVHSYYPVPTNSAHCLATTTYGFPFACAVGQKNIFAVQFHPEKSQRAGLTLLTNFMAWDGKI